MRQNLPIRLIGAALNLRFRSRVGPEEIASGEIGGAGHRFVERAGDPPSPVDERAIAVESDELWHGSGVELTFPLAWHGTPLVGFREVGIALGPAGPVT